MSGPAKISQDDLDVIEMTLDEFACKRRCTTPSWCLHNARCNLTGRGHHERQPNAHEGIMAYIDKLEAAGRFAKLAPETAAEIPAGYTAPLEGLAVERCGCYRCLEESGRSTGGGIPVQFSRMVVCATCGNKRCPHSTDHRHLCTGSNAAGQPGSRYA